MKLSEFITILQDELEKHEGDPAVNFITRKLTENNDDGWVEQYHGTVKNVRVNYQYPDQLEVRTTE